MNLDGLTTLFKILTKVLTVSTFLFFCFFGGGCKKSPRILKNLILLFLDSKSDRMQCVITQNVRFPVIPINLHDSKDLIESRSDISHTLIKPETRYR